MAKTYDHDIAVWNSLLTRGYLDAELAHSRFKSSHPEMGFAEPDPLVPDSEAVRKAVMTLQKRYGLAVTGVVDAKTRAFLLKPHCGVPDPSPTKLLKAFAAGVGHWGDPNLSYQFMEPMTPGLDKDAIRAAFRRACDTWEAVCTLRFRETSTQGDMRIRFGARHHGDAWPFDGRERTLAHAFYPSWQEPLNGDIHIDNDEDWWAGDAPAGKQKDLETVFLHEIGHAVGLEHTNNAKSVMFANYNGTVRKLFPVDAALIRQIYA